MSPEEMSTDLVNLATMVRLEHNPDGSREELARFLADVLPAHEAMIRAKAAKEIENLWGPFDREDDEASGMAETIVWHLRGLCDNCGGAPDSEPCGVAHRWLLTGEDADLCKRPAQGHTP